MGSSVPSGARKLWGSAGPGCRSTGRSPAMLSPGSAASSKANFSCPTVLGSPRDTLPCRLGTVTGDARLPRCQQGGSLRQPLFLAIFSCSRSAFSLTVSPLRSSLGPGIGGRRCLSWHLTAVTPAVAGRGGRLPSPCPGKRVGAGTGHWGDWEGTLGGSLLFGEGRKGATLGCEQGDEVLPPASSLRVLRNSRFGEVCRPRWSTQGWLSLLGAPKGCPALGELGESYSTAPISTP